MDKKVIIFGTLALLAITSPVLAETGKVAAPSDNSAVKAADHKDHSGKAGTSAKHDHVTKDIGTTTTEGQKQPLDHDQISGKGPGKAQGNAPQQKAGGMTADEMGKM